MTRVASWLGLALALLVLVVGPGASPPARVEVTSTGKVSPRKSHPRFGPGPTTSTTGPPVTTIPEPSTVPVTSPPPAPATSPPPDVVRTSDAGAVGSAVGSVYTTAEMGDSTASGIPLDDGVATFAHRTMAFGTRVRFTGPAGSVTATCTDRGPYVSGRTFDFSAAAMLALKGEADGVVTVEWSYA